MNYEDRVTKEYVEGLLGAMPKIATGSYVGDGGESVTIEFPFTPKFVVICSDTFSGSNYVKRPGGGFTTMGTEDSINLRGGLCYYTMREDNTFVLTHNGYTARYGLNELGNIYWYFGIG